MSRYENQSYARQHIDCTFVILPVYMYLSSEGSVYLSVYVCANRLPRIYDQLRQTINMSDASKDLKWWSQNHGVEMPMLWPTFEVMSVYSTYIRCTL